MSQPTTLEEITTGKPVTFSIQATGTEPLKYQWQCWKPEGEEDEGEAWQDITCDGLKFQDLKAALKLTAVKACNAGYYRCVVSNNAGSENSQCANLVVGKYTNIFKVVISIFVSISSKLMLFLCSC